MALIHCPACNKKISIAAESCPGCGEPRPGSGWAQASRSRLDGFIAFVLIMMALGAIGKIAGRDGGSAPAPSRESVARETVVNSEWDGSVWQAERYIKSRLKDPKSFEAIEWGQVALVPGGTYQVRCLYRAKNSFGGYVVEQLLVDLDRDGNVTGAVEMK